MQAEDLSLLGTPFSSRVPLRRWHGRTCCFLQVETEDATDWIYFNFEDPESFSRLDLQTDNKTETIFFNGTSRKFLRIANDCVYWSYYVSGPFQRFDDGTWIEPGKTEEKEKQTTSPKIIKNDKNQKAFALDYITGLLTKVPYEDDKENEQEKKEMPGIYVKLKELATTRVSDPKILAKNESVWEQAQSILEKLGQNNDFKDWCANIIIREGENPPILSTNAVIKTWEAIADLYGLDFEYLRSSVADEGFILFPAESMNDVKFTLGVILPELCLYPHICFKDFFQPFKFCGNIKTPKDNSVAYKTFARAFAFSCTEKNFMKIQRALHLALFEPMYAHLKKNFLNDFEHYWIVLNAPDVSYCEKRTKIPKGYKGFLNMESTLNVAADVGEIFFALMKDPNTLLNHQDIIIAKKAHLLKTALTSVYLNSWTEEWWQKISKHRDLIEIAQNSTGYFKEAHFDPENIQENVEQIA